MNERIPRRLRQEPLIEAIWQVQFEPSEGQAVGDILPGLLFGALRSQQESWQLKRMPMAEIPPAVARQDPNLRHAARHRVEAPDVPYLYQLGERVVTFNCRKPYIGWKAFKDRLLELIETLEGSGLIPAPLRHSLRYIDLLTLESPPSLVPLQLGLSVGDHKIHTEPVHLRLELREGDIKHVLQVASPAESRNPEGRAQGTVVDLETIADLPEQTWDGVRASLDRLHDASKGLFFQQLLTPDAVERMEPEY